MNFKSVAFRSFRYIAPMSIVLVGVFSYLNTGFLAYTVVIFAYLLVAVLDILLPAHKYNLTKEETDYVLKDKMYDFFLYLSPVTLLALTFLYLHTVTDNYENTNWVTLLGWVLSTATLTTGLGAVAGHELGHRTSEFEEFLGHVCDLCYCSMHRPISHNLGHHKNVSTNEDPVSSNYNEVVFSFWFRAMVGVFNDAWKIESKRLKQNNEAVYSIHNKVLVLSFIQLLFIVFIGVLFGWIGIFFFLASSFLTNCLHETVCYIEHYGLKRNKKENGSYEQVMPYHSWNSEQIVSRLLLLELPRHSDHHFRASKKYQSLNHHADVPTMPYGYAFMIAIAMIPPLWFKIMNKRVQEVQLKHGLSVSA